MKLSCALVTNVDSPELVAEAERLGYHRAWLYDSPAITSDVWMALALAAERTSTIGLGPGVLVPSLRHPMTNAAAIASLAAIAPAGWWWPSARGSPGGTPWESGRCDGRSSRST